MAESNPLGRRTIVIAIDASDHSFHALEWALNSLIACTPCASYGQDKVVLVHAKLPATSRVAVGGPGYLLSTELVVSMDKAQDREIEAFMSYALELCKEKKITAETKAVWGDPRDVICALVEKLKADFLVVGSHGYGAIKRHYEAAVECEAIIFSIMKIVEPLSTSKEATKGFSNQKRWRSNLTHYLLGFPFDPGGYSSILIIKDSHPSFPFDVGVLATCVIIIIYVSYLSMDFEDEIIEAGMVCNKAF